MESGLKEKAEVQVRRSVKKQPKMEKEEADQEKFNKVLDGCYQILFTTMNTGGDIFGLLDPLISDTQCHLHSVLILNILYKCYDKTKSSYYMIEKLGEKDREILSYAVLFSLLKTTHQDKVGMVVYEGSISHLNGMILSSRKKEKSYLINARKKFNSYSFDFTKNIESKNVREILSECQASSLMAPLKFLPCFATYLAVFDYIKFKRLPIIVSISTINKRVIDEGINCQYNVRNTEVRYYDFRENENRFSHRGFLHEFEKKMPTITFNCYSLTSDDVPEFAVNYDVRDLLMAAIACHIQLPRQSKLSDGYEDAEEYVRSLYKKNPVVFDEYMKYYELGDKLGLINAQYATLVRSSLEQGDESAALIVERSRKDIAFAIDHVYVSNYSRELRRLKSIDGNVNVDHREILEINTEKVTLGGIVTEG